MLKKDLILAIESSCDDSSIAIMSFDYVCVFYEKISQDNSKFGGVVPELASRLHVKSLPELLEKAKSYLNRLCAICVCQGPGLSLSLLTGVSMAKALSVSLSVPLILVNHLKAHIYSLFLNSSFQTNLCVLLVSGAHSLICYIDKNGDISLKATSLDDSLGESFDKVARMLNLNPNGAELEKLALKISSTKLSFKLPLLDKKILAFSFSGLKNAVRLKILENTYSKEEIAFAFERAACGHVLDKLKLVLENLDCKNLGVVGGVSANLFLRQSLKELCVKYDLNFMAPSLPFCSDNALMVARTGLELYKNKLFSKLDEGIYTKNTFFSNIKTLL